jgi:hypothetical protein
MVAAGAALVLGSREATPDRGLTSAEPSSSTPVPAEAIEVDAAPSVEMRVAAPPINEDAGVKLSTKATPRPTATTPRASRPSAAALKTPAPRAAESTQVETPKAKQSERLPGSVVSDVPF